MIPRQKKASEQVEVSSYKFDKILGVHVNL